MSYQLKTRYVVIDIPLPALAGLNIRQFSQKIPKDFVLITGFVALSKMKAIGVPPDATVSLCVNNKVINPVVGIEAEKSFVGRSRSKNVSFFPLNEQLFESSFVQGTVESDNKIGGTVYNVRIILRGKRIIKPN